MTYIDKNILILKVLVNKYKKKKILDIRKVKDNLRFNFLFKLIQKITKGN